MHKTPPQKVPFFGVSIFESSTFHNAFDPPLKKLYIMSSLARHVLELILKVGETRGLPLSTTQIQRVF